MAAVVEELARLEDPAGLEAQCLHERTVDLVRLHSLVTAAMVGHVAEWDGRALWATDRSKSPGGRLARDANCAKRTAAGWVHLGRETSRLPATYAAWLEGRISTDHARRLARAADDGRLHRFLACEERLVAGATEHAGAFTAFDREISRWEQQTDDELHDPTDPDDLPKGAKRRKAGRTCSIRDDGDGFELTATLTRMGGAIFKTTLQRITDELWHDDWGEARRRLGPHAQISDADLSRTHRQRMSDALVEMARRAGAQPRGGLMPKPLIVVHVTADDMCGPIRETFNGLVHTRRDIADLIADGADWQRVIYAPTGQPVDVTSTQRNFTGALRRAVQLRDRVCAHPTCDVEAERCQVDHIIEHSDGGPTSLDNARLLCPRHNMQRPGRRKTPPRGGDDEDDNRFRRTPRG